MLKNKQTVAWHFLRDIACEDLRKMLTVFSFLLVCFPQIGYAFLGARISPSPIIYRSLFPSVHFPSQVCILLSCAVPSACFFFLLELFPLSAFLFMIPYGFQLPSVHFEVCLLNASVLHDRRVIWAPGRPVAHADLWGSQSKGESCRSAANQLLGAFP